MVFKCLGHDEKKIVQKKNCLKRTYTQNTALLLPANVDINMLSEKPMRISFQTKNIGGIMNSQVFNVASISINIIFK